MVAVKGIEPCGKAIMCGNLIWKAQVKLSLRSAVQDPTCKEINEPGYLFNLLRRRVT
jgi:hypothetical protein